LVLTAASSWLPVGAVQLSHCRNVCARHYSLVRDCSPSHGSLRLDGTRSRLRLCEGIWVPLYAAQHVHTWYVLDTLRYAETRRKPQCLRGRLALHRMEKRQGYRPIFAPLIQLHVVGPQCCGVILELPSAACKRNSHSMEQSQREVPSLGFISSNQWAVRWCRPGSWVGTPQDCHSLWEYCVVLYVQVLSTQYLLVCFFSRYFVLRT
jgi:hypothetical protein